MSENGDTEPQGAPEVQEQQEEQAVTPDSTQEQAEPQDSPQTEEPEADTNTEAEAKEPEASPPEEQPAAAEPEAEQPEQGEKAEDKAEEAKTEEEAAQPEPEADEEKPVEEEPVVITPEGNPHWLSTEDVLAKDLPDSEVDNFKNFYFKHAHSLQVHYDDLKNCCVETEYITLSKEEIDALTVEGELSEEHKQCLDGLKVRIDSAMELYEKDGALVMINGRSAKDAYLDRTDESFVETIRDSVINSLEFEKQSICAYSVWKDQEHQPGAFRRGMNKLRASLRRSRSGSAPGRRRPKLEEEKKDEEEKAEEAKPEGEGEKEGEEGEKAGEEPKPAAEGEEAAAKDEPPAAEGEGATEVTVQADVENDDAKPEEAAPKEEEAPKEEPEAAAEPPKEDEEPKVEVEVVQEPPKQEEEAKKEDEEAKADGEEKKEDGEIQAAPAEEGGAKEEEKGSDEEVKPKSERKASKKKQKIEEPHHQHKAAKSEPLDNRVLRAFGRVMGAQYQVKDGQAALDQLRSSAQIRRDLNKLKAFGGVEGVQVSMSVCRWSTQISDHTGMIFRGFVYDNELRALSQYNDTTYYPNVVHYKDTIISGKVQNFFQENVKEALKDLNNYIVDIFVAPDKMYVLRLNPFYTAVGACLFTWNDGRVLTKGPFQFRVVDSPKIAPEAYSSYQPCWQDMLNSVLTQRKAAESRPSRGCVIL